MTGVDAVRSDVMDNRLLSGGYGAGPELRGACTKMQQRVSLMATALTRDIISGIGEGRRSDDQVSIRSGGCWLRHWEHNRDGERKALCGTLGPCLPSCIAPSTAQRIA